MSLVKEDKAPAEKNNKQMWNYTDPLSAFDTLLGFPGCKQIHYNIIAKVFALCF